MSINKVASMASCSALISSFLTSHYHLYLLLSHLLPVGEGLRLATSSQSLSYFVPHSQAGLPAMMRPSNSQLSKLILSAFLLLFPSLILSVKAQCIQSDTSTYFGPDLYVKESGQFNPDWVQTTTLNQVESGWSSIFIQNSYLRSFFEIKWNGTDFVLEVRFFAHLICAMCILFSPGGF